jgi:exosortase D (VPLPA-CTERM-specific)
VSESRVTRWLLGAGLLLALVGLYWAVAPRLVRQWASDDDYTHGFLILPLALYFVWDSRARLKTLPVKPSPWGAGLLLGGLLLLWVGSVGAELFLQRSSFIVVVAGLVWLILGTAFLRALAFPIAFLIFMVPLPGVVMNAVAFPLQLFAARTATFCMQMAGIPVLREGNVIVLAQTTLEVAEACSGIRSLQALLALGAVYGYFTQRLAWKKWALVILSVPIAIAANAFRVAGTGFLAHYWGSEMAQGFYHGFAGWIVFVVAFALLLACGAVLGRVRETPGKAAPSHVDATGGAGPTTRAMTPWACVLALGLMGAAWGLVAARSGAEPTLIRKPFAEFPLSLQGWQGRDLQVEERVLEILNPSDYLLRAYVPPEVPSAVGAFEGARQSATPVWLYVAYYASQRTGANYHSPRNCLPGGGWQFKSAGIVSDALPGTPGRQVNRVVVEKDFERQLILYWYQERGRVVASEYAAKGYLVWDAITRNRSDGALVRVSTTVVGSEEEAYRHALELLRVAWEPLLLHLPG